MLGGGGQESCAKAAGLSLPMGKLSGLGCSSRQSLLRRSPLANCGRRLSHAAWDSWLLSIVWSVLSGPWALRVTRHWGEEGVPLNKATGTKEGSRLQVHPDLALDSVTSFLINHLVAALCFQQECSLENISP